MQLGRLVGWQASSAVPWTPAPRQPIAPNSIVGRAEFLLAYLQRTDAAPGWGQFLDADGGLVWSRVTLGGHSRGASYAPILSRLFPLGRGFSTGGPGDACVGRGCDELGGMMPWMAQPLKMDALDLYTLNPGFVGVEGLAQRMRFVTHGETSNGTFGVADLVSRDALAAKLGGARNLFTDEVCFNSSSSHMCMGPCDAWQPVNRTTKLPLLMPVWQYMLTNDEPPSAASRALQVRSTVPHYSPPKGVNCSGALSESARDRSSPPPPWVQLARAGEPQPSIQPSCWQGGRGNCFACWDAATGACIPCGGPGKIPPHE